MTFFENSRKDRIIEFQSQLLGELALSSSSLQKSEEHIRNIASAALGILDISFFFIVQPGNGGEPELVVYWSGTAAAPLRETAEQLIREAVAAEPSLRTIKEFKVAKTIAISSEPLPDLTLTEIDIRSKGFPIDNPQSTGIAGLGLKHGGRRRREDDVAVESILTAFMNCIRSTKALKAYTREIERFATRDPLTGLYNQIAFWDLLTYESERSRRQKYKFSLLLVDVDNFKTLNDSYGHDTGDRLLKEMAEVLKSTVRAGDIAARYAGDQFVAILPVCDEGQAYIVARRLLEAVRGYSLKLSTGAVLKLTVSIGVAVFPDHARESRDLYLLADRMLLQAKTFGKDRLSMPSEQDDLEVLKNMGDMNILVLEALSQKKIVPYFQPIVNLLDRKVEAYEVLTRIVMNDRVIPAAEFIETAESMGAIGKIDFQLIELAFSKVRATGYDGNLFLNLSPKALVLNEFMPTVRELLQEYGVSPEKMIFEITERDTVKNVDLIAKYIRELKHEGFRFAIDDFGAGYSSFQYIRSFSIDFLKVDGEIVRNMNGKNNVDKAIVSTIASLSQKLGIKTIAEFVETEDVMSAVGLAGIDYAQGYYIKRPSPDLL